MDGNLLFAAGVQYLLLLLAVSVHESAHAWMADLCGDPTARKLGRVSLNPFPHLDLFGTALLPALLLAFGVPTLFGWGRPAPVVAESLKNPYRDGIRVAAAGPVANLLLAFLATVALLVAIHALGPDARQAGYLTLIHNTEKAAGMAGFPLMFTLVNMAVLNAFLAVFNLIPLPPLDGGQIALHLFPPDWAARLAVVRPYGFMIGMTLALSGVVTLFLLPFYGFLSVLIQYL